MVFARLDEPLLGPRPRPRLAAGADDETSTWSDIGVAAPEGLALLSSKLPSPVEINALEVRLKADGNEIVAYLRGTCHPV